MLRFSTAGESHGKGLIAFIEGIPAGLKVDIEEINSELARRQRGFGRGQRMKIETDTAEIISGVRHKRTLGSPITLFIENKDFQNWIPAMSPILDEVSKNSLTNPRPGHADLAGLMKYGVKDFRDILERASARETAAKVAIGAVCKIFLKEFGINVRSFILQIGNVTAKIKSFDGEKIWCDTESSVVRCPDKAAEKEMIKLIEKAASNGDTLGGKLAILVSNVVAGLGSHTQWDLKLDGKLAQSLIAIQAFKSVEFGEGTNFAELPGSLAHDEIFHDKKNGFYRKTNHAGGIEGGMTNGEPIFITCVLKPIPSLVRPLRSVDIFTKKPVKAEAVRSDICVVPAAGIVAEAAVSIEIAKALIEQFGPVCMKDIKNNYNLYVKRIKNI
ncbi:MAG: chorismate synthase [Elusimicrobiota bacterium]|jgi:chorismate synthase|nr:chorismate synthase [Elusimicrobiota bacterium]